MKKLKDIKLSLFQLNFLLNEKEMEAFYYLLKHGVYCPGCNSICKKGLANYTLRLDWINDIIIEGKCAACGHKVVRVMELGESILFFEKAMNYREILQN